MDNQQYDLPPDNSLYLETVDPRKVVSVINCDSSIGDISYRQYDLTYLIDFESPNDSDNSEYAVYGANKEYLAAEVKKLRADIELLVARPIYSVLKETITHSVIFM